MINKLRARIQDEKGFTLIELLVVILIIGILAAIALPAFLNQREKAQDSTAKSDARTAQTAMETYYTDNQTYVGADKTKLIAIEPALGNVTTLDLGTPAVDGYTITVTSGGSNKVKYSITNAKGVVTRACDQQNVGGCGDKKTW